MKRTRPEDLEGSTKKVKTGCGNLYVTLNHDEEGKLFECFAQMGKGGGCASSQAEALGRLISLILRSNTNIAIEEIRKELYGISCHLPIAEGAKSCSDGISSVLRDKE